MAWEENFDAMDICIAICLKTATGGSIAKLEVNRLITHSMKSAVSGQLAMVRLTLMRYLHAKSSYTLHHTSEAHQTDPVLVSASVVRTF